MPKQWVSRTFRTCVPGIQAAGLCRWPRVLALTSDGFEERDSSLARHGQQVADSSAGHDR